MPTIADVRSQFSSAGVYLDTASVGLPPRPVLDAVRATLDSWAAGLGRAPAFDEAVESSRSAYARLVHVDSDRVAIGPQVSVLAGLVAASLPDGAEVLVPQNEFTSVSFPFLAQQHRGIRVREVPLDDLVGSVTDRTALVAVASVQSADGRVADLDGLAALCRDTETQVFLDTTQSDGWLPLDAGRFTYTACGGYKWLLAPRGTAFFTVDPDVIDSVVPVAAGWYAGEDRWDSIYGGPLRLARSARRFDISPAWQSWVGQAASLEFLLDLGIDALHAHATSLANGFRAGVGMQPSDSAIVSVAVTDNAAQALTGAGIAASMRAGRLRLAFHVNNDESDVDRTLEALRSCIAG